MRPTSLEDGQKRKLQATVVGVIVLIALTSVVLVMWDSSGSDGRGDIYFSEIKLSDKGIEVGDNVYLYAQVANSGDQDYENIKIRISTHSSRVNISYELKGGDYLTESEGDNEFYLVKEIPPLWAGKDMGERSKLYAFGVQGSLNIGATSMTVPVKAQVIANGELMDSEVFELTIKRG